MATIYFKCNICLKYRPYKTAPKRAALDKGEKMNIEEMEKVEITLNEKCLLIQAISKQLDDLEHAINVYISDKCFNDLLEGKKNSIFNTGKTEAEIIAEVQEQIDDLLFYVKDEYNQFEDLLNKIKGVAK